MPSGRIGRENASTLTRAPGDTPSVGHGGFREGSGRKPVLDGGIKRTFVLTPVHLAMIDAWAQRHMIDNRSAALRHLIEMAPNLEDRLANGRN
jgi:hypothetical protein